MKNFAAFFTVLFLGLTLSTAGVAQNKRAKAKKLFDQGIAALEEHDYKAALAAFEGAYDASPHWMVLAHIGTCRAKLNKPVEAILALEKYLAEAGDKIEPDERQAALRLLEEQQKKIGVLQLIITPDGSEAKIDGDSIGRAPFERILLKSGPHHIIVIDGDKVHERDINISPGQEQTLRIPEDTLPPPPPPVAAPASQPEPKTDYTEETYPTAQPAAPEPEPRYGDAAPQEAATPEEQELPDGVSIPFFVSMGVAGAGVITGAVGFGFFIYYANSENNYIDTLSEPQWSDYSWEDTCSSVVVSSREEEYYCETEGKRRDFAKGADNSLIPAIVGSSVAVAAGITSIVFYFHPEWFSSSNDSASLAVTPALGPETSGLFLTGSF